MDDEGRGPEVVHALRYAYLSGTLGQVCSDILRDGHAHRLDELLAIVGARRPSGEWTNYSRRVCRECLGPILPTRRAGRPRLTCFDCKPPKEP